MQVFGVTVHPSESKVRLEGPYQGEEATLVHYEAETWPMTYTVVLSDGSIETGVAHACITVL